MTDNIKKKPFWTLTTSALIVAALVLLPIVLFPFFAGIMHVDIAASETTEAAVRTWNRFVWNEGNFFAFWQNLWRSITGNHPVDSLGSMARSLKYSGGFSLALVIGAIIAKAIYDDEMRTKNVKASVTRKLLRGPQLLSRVEVPGEISALAASSLSDGDDKKERDFLRKFQALVPEKLDIEAIRADAIIQRRALSDEEAAADAHVNLVGEFAAKNGMVRIGNLPIPRDLENYHTLICASTGTGKTVALRQLLTDLRQRGDRVIIIDAGYDLSQNFRQKDDLLLSPLDADSVGWDLRNEARHEADWTRFAASYLPAIGSGESAEWTKKAQAFFANVCRQVGAETTNQKLLEIFSNWPVEALKKLLDGTSSQTLVAGGESSYLTSVRNNIGEKLGGWQFGKSGDFSLRDYMTSSDRRWLWLPYHDAKKGICGPAISAWIDILVLAGLERASQNTKQKTWIIIDELDSIGVITGLKEAVTRLRKSNIAVVAAVQDISQLVENYGKETAQTIFGNFSNRLYLRANSVELAKKISEEIGECEWQETRVQVSENENKQGQGTNGRGKGSSASIQIIRSAIQLPSQIQALETRTGFVKFAGINKIFPINLPIKTEK